MSSSPSPPFSISDWFSSSSLASKFLTFFSFLLCQLVFISACTAFGSPLHESIPSHSLRPYLPYTRILYSWNGYYASDSLQGPYSDLSPSLGIDAQCKTGGNAFLAFQVFVFLSSLPAMLLILARFFGIHFRFFPSSAPASVEFVTPAAASLPAATRDCLYWETILLSISFISEFLSVVLWGALCFSQTEAAPSTGIPPSVDGRFIQNSLVFGLNITCIILLAFLLGVQWVLRRKPDLAMGVKMKENNGQTNESANDNGESVYSNSQASRSNYGASYDRYSDEL